VRARATYKLTWEEIVALYLLTLGQPALNTRARYNVCPTTAIDTIVGPDGSRDLVRTRWGLIPSWWSNPLKEMKLATFNARSRDSSDKANVSLRVLAQSVPHSGVRLLRVAGHTGRQTALVFHCARRLTGTHGGRAVGRMAPSRRRRAINRAARTGS
jgi:hypothetical protein